ncbi:xanthine/uracil permease [Croceicoccus mobilis]|uniref:Xanthine/uracil permease n=2 Tax=Croceicoccus mobilis TaxID=1703339 RepID=A0A917DVJ2_9SPHN|nr:xanthine/uracil permease [Croceicoccus mobilis]
MSETEATMPTGAPPAAATDSRLERMFELASRGTNVRTEVLAGITTFLTMAYIVLVNPAILGAAGMPIAAVAAATCFAAAFASILMGFTSNTPLAMAPGMGLNAYFSFTVVQQMGVPWQTALGCVFVSGIAFFLLTLTGIRQLIVSAIPNYLFAAVAGGIGLFIGFIGFKDAGIIVANPATFVALGDLKEPGAALAIFGLLLIAALSVWNVKGAMLIGIVATTVLGWAFGMVTINPEPYSLEAMTATIFQLDLGSVFGFDGAAGLGIVEIIFVFLFVDLFDNIGTLVAVTKRAGLMTPDGKIPRLNRILFTDATATVVGSMAGTSTVTSYVESAAGVQAGGRTGLTAIVTGVLFLAMMFVAPYAQLIPLSATAPALIIVGGLMLLPLAEVEWEDPLSAIPAFLTVAMIPLTFSIANGLAFGITAHALLKLVRGTITRTDWFLLVLAALFVIRFVWMGAA